MKETICECPRPKCHYRWIPRVQNPKECPDCKHRFSAIWGDKLKRTEVKFHSKEELLKIRRDIEEWNEKGRWE
jgi:hypothetical protein